VLGRGPKAPVRFPERQSSSEETLDRGEFASHRRTARTQVPDVSSLIQPEASGTTLPMANVVRPLGPVAIAGIESLQTPVSSMDTETYQYILFQLISSRRAVLHRISVEFLGGSEGAS